MLDHIASLLRNLSEQTEQLRGHGGYGLAQGCFLSVRAVSSAAQVAARLTGSERPPGGPGRGSGARGGRGGGRAAGQPAAQELELGASCNCSRPRSPSGNYGQ